MVCMKRECDCPPEPIRPHKVSKGAETDPVYTGHPPGASIFELDQVDLATGMWLPAGNGALNMMEVTQSADAQAAEAAAGARTAAAAAAAADAHAATPHSHSA